MKVTYGLTAERSCQSYISDILQRGMRMDELPDVGDLDQQYCHVQTSEMVALEMVAFVWKHNSESGKIEHSGRCT